MSPSSSSYTPLLSTADIAGVVVGSVLFVAILLGVGIFLCLRRRPKKQIRRGPPIDLGPPDEQRYLRPPAPPSIFSPFEYQSVTSGSNNEEVSEYGLGSSPGGRITNNPSSHALLTTWDSTTHSSNPLSPHSTYSREKSAFGTQWGELASARDGSSVGTPHSSLAPTMLHDRGKRRLVATNGSERDPASPIVAVNRMRSGGASPPPYDTK
jgi:hypothetical protein